jgi:hypothetical protein
VASHFGVFQRQALVSLFIAGVACSSPDATPPVAITRAPIAVGNEVSLTGTALDSPLSTTRQPALSRHDGGYLAVWVDSRTNLNELFATPLTGSLAVLAPTGLRLTPDQDGIEHPSLDFDGTSHFLVWTQSGASILGSRMVGMQLTELGAPGPQLVLNDDGSSKHNPRVDLGATNHLVTWTDQNSTVHALRVSFSGTPLDATPLTLQPDLGTAPFSLIGADINSAFDGTQHLVVWQHFSADGGSDVYGARISDQGVLLDPSGIPLATSADFEMSPAVALDGADFLVTWFQIADAGSIRATRVSPQGVALDVPPIDLDDGLVPPSLQSLTFYNGAQLVSAIEIDGGAVVTWVRPSPPATVRAARVTPQALVLDPGGIVIGPAASGAISSPMALASTDATAAMA